MQYATIPLLVMIGLLLSPSCLFGQISSVARWADTLVNQYRIIPNIIYNTANNYEVKLDVYVLRKPNGPAPTLMYIHGGGWTSGGREMSALHFIPYLELGWQVVTVSYRLAKVSPAPAAVEDCLCALRWMYKNAKEYNIDTTRIVATGHSAGGHLALMMGMTPPSAGLDRQCPGEENLKVAAVVNWFGITDVKDLLDGANKKSYAVTWLGSLPDRNEIAERVSPLTYVRNGLPPIISIHGDADPTVPYEHAARLHKALEKVDVPNKLVTIKGGKHGGFTNEDFLAAYASINSFLKSLGLEK